MITKDKLIKKVAKHAGISEHKATLAYETIFLEQASFRKQQTLKVEAKSEKLVKVQSKPKIQKVEIIKEVPVEVIKTVEKLKTVEVVKEVPVEVLKEVKVIDKEAIAKWKVKAEELSNELALVKQLWRKENESLKKSNKTLTSELNQAQKMLKTKPPTEYIEVYIEKPVEVVKHQEKIKKVEVIRQVPVEVIKEVVKEVRVEKQVPYEVIKEVTLVREIEKEVEVPVEVYVKDETEVSRWKAKAEKLQTTIEQYKERVAEIQVAAKEAVALLKAELADVTKKAKAVPKVIYEEVVKEVKVKDDSTIHRYKEKLDGQQILIQELKQALKLSKSELTTLQKQLNAKPNEVVKEVIKEVKVKDESGAKKWQDKLTRYEEEISQLRLKLKQKPKEIIKEVVKEVPVEVIREVEVVKSIDLNMLKEMMARMKTKEVSKKVIGETRKEGDAVIVDKRVVKAGTNQVDDLTLVEGIGPKIATLLHRQNIYTFASLATTSVKKIQNILDEAGQKYNMHDPGSWPAQAKLAANGEWEELKAWQDKLKAGKE